MTQLYARAPTLAVSVTTLRILFSPLVPSANQLIPLLKQEWAKSLRSTNNLIFLQFYICWLSNSHIQHITMSQSFSTSNKSLQQFCASLILKFSLFMIKLYFLILVDLQLLMSSFYWSKTKLFVLFDEANSCQCATQIRM